MSTAYPSLQVTAGGQEAADLSYLSYGGFMGGWAALSVGQWGNENKSIRSLSTNHSIFSDTFLTSHRDGEYGGPLVLFNTEVSQVLILSPLNNYLVSSLHHRQDTDSLQWGLMASVENIPQGESLRTVLVHGRTLEEAFTRWGEVLQLTGMGEVKERSEDLVTNYLGFWCDNGAFYYYHTLPGMDYEQTILTLHQNLTARLPIKYINYDSWWYIKGEDLGTKSWTPQHSIFPHGMESLYSQTGLPVVAHNRQSRTLSVTNEREHLPTASVQGSGSLELCLNGIRDLASLTSSEQP